MRVSSVVAACAAVALCSAAALAQQDPHLMIGNVASTHVRILGTMYAESGMTYYQCVAFKNEGETPINAVTFKLFYIDRTKHDAGTQDIEVRAPLAPHAQFVPAGFGQGDDPSKMPNCAPLAVSQKIIDVTFILPGRIEYADGTIWDPLKKTPAPSPSPE